MNVKIYRNIALTLWLLVASAGALAAQTYGIIPAPRQLTERDGQFVFDRRTAVLVTTPDAAFGEVARNFAAQLSLVSGWNVEVKQAADATAGAARKSVVFAKEAGMALEEYTLNITPERILLCASHPNGLYYAVQSLYQLLPAQVYGDKRVGGVRWAAPCCDIQDAPKFGYRGMMLDVGRYFMPKEFIKKFIDLLAMNKQNIFHWHLTEDQGWRIEIKKYPRLTEVGAWRPETCGYGDKNCDGTPHGGFYTQDDIREIVEYARQRYVTVMPEVELPGHAVAALAAYPEFSCFPDRKYEVDTHWGVKPDVFCPSAKTFTFLEDVFSELFALFPSPYYCIGGDECPKERWKESPYCQDLMKVLGLQTEEQLQAFFMTRIATFLKEKGGKTSFGWDDILDAGALPSVVALSYRGHNPARKALRHNTPTVLCPNRWCYIDYYQEDPEAEVKSQGMFLPLSRVYNYYPEVDSIPQAVQDKYMLGVEGCLWTEFIQTPERAEYMGFPRIVALAEVGWCDKAHKDWASFKQRMVKGFARLDQKQVGYSKAFYNVLFNFARKDAYPKPVTLTVDLPDCEIRYTTDGSKPTRRSPLYTAPIEVKQGDTIRAQGFALKGGKAVGVAVSKTFGAPDPRFNY
jgi:hexosaminidase